MWKVIEKLMIKKRDGRGEWDKEGKDKRKRILKRSDSNLIILILFYFV